MLFFNLSFSYLYFDFSPPPRFLFRFLLVSIFHFLYFFCFLTFFFPISFSSFFSLSFLFVMFILPLHRLLVSYFVAFLHQSFTLYIYFVFLSSFLHLFSFLASSLLPFSLLSCFNLSYSYVYFASSPPPLFPVSAARVGMLCSKTNSRNCGRKNMKSFWRGRNVSLKLD